MDQNKGSIHQLDKYKPIILNMIIRNKGSYLLVSIFVLIWLKLYSSHAIKANQMYADDPVDVYTIVCFSLKGISITY